jgi:hypothetical protein
MVNYQCKICSKIFKQKGDYLRHENRKNPCENISTNLPQKSTNLPPTINERTCKENDILPPKIKCNRCKYCLCDFSRRDALVRHQKNRCK